MTHESDSADLPTLRVRGVRKHFTLHLRDGRDLPVLHGVDLDAAAGECVALVGASGQGKSTLIKCLYGNYGVDSGSILLRTDGGEIDMARATPQQIIGLRERAIAYVSQFLRAVPRVPAIDVVAERLLQAHPVTADLGQTDAWQAAQEAAREEVAALFERLNLPRALWQLPPATFSGGEQQRVNIARGFILPSDLLLLDEPTASLDAANRRVVIQLIHEAKTRGATVIGIFHDEEVRDAVATRCVTLPAASAELETTR
ncbi:phosphonate C-P lyase system protein PhnL [Variovorax sp. Sphag1AA]|uniref:phosphonate C-P lyase system protein PhnL n=1 Tax=Variovorax sp. Sphag1AA TaxID=2587027 RepID=UPI0017E2BC84|nr:phosphonate C-P lyase system protein PhnL [Variovorax sp. Sphag1AA]MBB3178168.1 alpha-D-ribose 1-methylphosphonate 5-triphosphate synthase subunit PhnL [Variovorax sp. Sphag1AA]